MKVSGKPPLSPSWMNADSTLLCSVAGSFGIDYLFERKPLRLFLINGGYQSLQYTLIGLILGVGGTSAAMSPPAAKPAGSSSLASLLATA